MDKIQIKFVLRNKGIKYCRVQRYQNRTIIRIPKIERTLYRSILEELNTLNLTKEKLYVKIDISFIEKLWMFLNGRRYTIKDYRS